MRLRSSEPFPRLLRRALEFLHIDYDGQTRFETRQGSGMYRYRWLQRLFFVPAMRGGRMLQTLQQRARKYNPDGSKRPSLLRRVVAWNKIPASPAPLMPQLRETIRATLRPDVALLSRLIGRDLSHWLAG